MLLVFTVSIQKKGRTNVCVVETDNLPLCLASLPNWRRYGHSLPFLPLVASLCSVCLLAHSPRQACRPNYQCCTTYICCNLPCLDAWGKKRCTWENRGFWRGKMIKMLVARRLLYMKILKMKVIVPPKKTVSVLGNLVYIGSTRLVTRRFGVAEH